MAGRRGRQRLVGERHLHRAGRGKLDVERREVVGEHAEDAADATNRMSIRGRRLWRRLGGDEGQKVLLDRYAQVLAGAVRDELAPVDPAGDVPLFVFANEPLSSMIVAHGLPGEVVVDYHLRLKRELDAKRLWINAYAKASPCYIASTRQQVMQAKLLRAIQEKEIIKDIS